MKLQHQKVIIATLKRAFDGKFRAQFMAAQTLPVGRIGTPEDVAEVIMLLLGNGFMTDTVIECDGGRRIK